MANHLSVTSTKYEARTSIPIIDFSRWISEKGSSDRQSMARELVEACHITGFVYIINHGMSPKLLAEAFEWTERFFDLETEQKMQAAHPKESKSFRGYSWLGLEKATTAYNSNGLPTIPAEQSNELIDYNESYGVGSDKDTTDINVWIPENVLPGFRDFVSLFYHECWKIAEQVLKALSVGLGLESEEFLLQFHSEHSNGLSLRHYPPVPASKIESTEMERLSAHTDFNAVTLLFQDDCGGLEIQQPGSSGEFIHAKPIEGSLVMNIGDVLSRWSNDYLISTVHRVSLPPLQDRFTGQERMTRNRYSIPFFVNPKRDTMMECLPACFNDENPPKYKPMLYRDYFDMRASQVF